MKIGLPVVLAPWVLGLFLGCAGARAPVARPLAGDDPRPVALLAALAREGEARHALRGVAKLAVDGPDASGRGRQIVVLERPARLRVEILGLLDQTLALLVTDGVRYRVVRSGDHSVEQGAVHASMLAEVAGIALSPALAVRVLLGAPVDESARVQGGASLGDGGVRVALAPHLDLSRETLDFDADAHLRRWVRLGADGEPSIEAVYDDWRVQGAGVFPFALELVDHASTARVRITWSSVELDPSLPPGLFDVSDAP